MMPFSPKLSPNWLPRPHGLSRQHTLTLGSQSFHPHVSGALFAPESGVLLIADLHLEQGASMARRGVHVPPFDTTATLRLLGDVLEETKPQKLILLGDSFHDSEVAQGLQVDHRRRLDQLIATQETIWLSGNHDAHITGDHYQLGDIVLRHEPSSRLSGLEIAGHLHPGCTVIQRGVRLRGKCFVQDDKRILLPAFGAYTGGFDVSQSAFDGLFDEKTARAFMIGRSAIHNFPLKKLR
jgi:DNA ligase-associated metallophosphoesterase